MAKANNDQFDINDVRSRVDDIIGQLTDEFVGRDRAVRAQLLALLGKGHCLIIGPPGTGKSALTRCLTSHIVGARYFEKTLGSFTTLDEMVGPPDIKAFQAGKWQRSTADRFAESEIVFADEPFKCNDGALNSLLTILNERRFDGKDIPLRSCFGATNWPEVRQMTEKVEALYDRWLIRDTVNDLEGEQLVELTDCDPGAYKARSTITLDELDKLTAYITDKVDCPKSVIRLMALVCMRVRKSDITVSDRRFWQAVNVVKVNAFLEGRTEAVAEDLECLQFVFWNQEADIEQLKPIVDTCDQEIVQRCITDIDGARGEYQTFGNLDRKQRLDRRPKVIATMRNAAIKVLLRVAPDRAAQFAEEEVVEELRTSHEKEVRGIAKSNGVPVRIEDLLVHMAVTDDSRKRIAKALKKMRAEYQSIKKEAAEDLGLKGAE